MRFATAIIFCVLSCSLSLLAAPRAAGRPGQTTSAPAAKGVPAKAQEDAAAMRDDLKRMRALVQQMETNLAFVDTSQSPLKHQFQLEIDMWKTLISHMERRLDASHP